ncbi:MAG: sigma-70 family RNA polymerase sigma factor [Bacteroidales bacterium]|nr:sigma-70 family RNA polymerase sigma factor [Bacteroidales bacterium]
MELDERTFKELIHRHRDMIWSICKRYRLSPAWTTEDAFHEVLCDLWRGFENFDKRSSERTWIFRVATNTMISLTRKTANKPANQTTAFPEPSYNDENYHDLVEIINATTEPDRTIINAHVQGFSYAEIAKITGLTIGAVSMRLTRALRKIRKQYNQK